MRNKETIGGKTQGRPCFHAFADKKNPMILLFRFRSFPDVLQQTAMDVLAALQWWYFGIIITYQNDAS